MIVKNEEKLLKRCLDSYKGLFDEIIIVDTGSDDNTKKIASEYTDKIYDFEWINDFAAARNFAFSKATCDYIFSADADEVLDEYNHSAFSDLKAVMLPEIEIVQMKYINCTEYNTVYNCLKEYRPKLFKRLRTFEWQSPIHETVRLDPVIYDSDIEILHMPDSQHSKRDFKVFTNSINNNIKLPEYVIKMFCKELWIAGDDDDFREVKEIFENILTAEYSYTQNNGDCRRMIDCILARIYRITGDFNNFMKICLANVASNPFSEICLELGDYYYAANDFETAILWYINASDETDSLIDIHSGGDTPLFRLNECYRSLSRLALSKNDMNLYNIYSEMSDNYMSQAKKWRLPEEL